MNCINFSTWRILSKLVCLEIKGSLLYCVQGSCKRKSPVLCVGVQNGVMNVMVSACPCAQICIKHTPVPSTEVYTARHGWQDLAAQICLYKKGLEDEPPKKL